MDAGVDVAMMRGFTSRGVVATEVAVNEKRFVDAGGEILELDDPEDLKQLLDDFTDFDSADNVVDDVVDDYNLTAEQEAFEQEAFKKEGKTLEELFQYGADNYNKGILKMAVKENVSIDDARTLFFEKKSADQDAMLAKAIKELGKNPTKKDVADATARVLKDFGEVKTKTGGSSGFDGKWWDEQGAVSDIQGLLNKHMSATVDRARSVGTKATGPRPLSSYKRDEVSAIQAIEDYYGGLKSFSQKMLSTPKGRAISRHMFNYDDTWETAAKRVEEERLFALEEELPDWNAVKNNPAKKKDYLNRNPNPEEFYSGKPDAKFYVEKSKNSYGKIGFNEEDISDIFDDIEGNLKNGTIDIRNFKNGFQVFPDQGREYIKTLKQSEQAGTAFSVLKDGLNRYFMWDPKVRKAAKWKVAYDADGNISGFALFVPEKLRAGLTGEDILDNIAVTHLGAFQKGGGTGSALLADAHRAAKAEGIGMYVHDVTDSSKAFYYKLGFKKTTNQYDSIENMMAPPDFMYKTVGKTDAEVQSYQNIVAGFRKAAADEGKRAQRAIYFDPNRPWIERSLNHPLLALYPLSYMVGKVIPEFTRLLVATPFAKALGGTRPFLGVEALRITAEATVAATQYDPEFSSWIQDNPEAWILINWLLPYTPDNIGFGLSSTVRKLGVAKGMAGEGFDVGRFPQEGFNQVVSASLPGSWRLGFNAANQIFTQNPVADLAPDSLNITDILQGKN